MRPIFRILLLVIAVFVVYYPALFAGFNSVDDLKMVNSISNYQNWSLAKLFFPGGGYYYRPLLYLTYIVDHDLWGMHASIMHFENVLLHLGNTLLVYIVAGKLLKGESVARLRWLPFLAALLFAWHPINTESVNWVSGRTDLLAGFFILASLYFILASCEKNRLLFSAPAAFCFFFACLFKESAVFFLPAALWIPLVYNADFSFRNFTTVFKQRSIHLLTMLLGCGGYFVVRGFALKTHDSGIGHVAGNMIDKSVDLLDFSRIVLKVIGFYAKKMIFPWPLNFGIIYVSDWYVIAGVILLLFCLYWLIRPTINNALLLMSACIMSAALLVALGGAAWTPIGERYLYISSAPFVLALVGVGPHILSKFLTHKLQIYLFVALLVVVGLSTFMRTLTWQDNVKLYSDTVEKSPEFIPARNELAAALIAQGRMDEAREHIEIVFKVGADKGYSPSYLNRAKLLAHEGRENEARTLLLKYFDPRHKNRGEVLSTLFKINLKRLEKVSSDKDKKEIYEENLGYLFELQDIRKKTFNMYRIGKIYLALGEDALAAEYFSLAFKDAPVQAHYREAAGKMARRLKYNE